MINMVLKIERWPENPIAWPGKWDWRVSKTYNPDALFAVEHTFFTRQAD